MRTIPVLLLLILSGCIGQTTPVHQYLLREIRPKAAADTGSPVRATIVIGPVSLPPQLATLAIVVRPGPEEVRSSSTHFWAAPLDELMAAVIRRYLSTLLHSDRVFLYPGPRFARKRYQVELAVDRFDGMPGGTFTCRLTWSISDLERRRLVHVNRFSLTLPVQGTRPTRTT